MKLSFDQKQVKSMEDEFSRLDLDNELRQELINSASIFSKYIQMSEIAIRGFILKSLKQFQEQEKLTIKEWREYVRTEPQKFLEKDAELRKIISSIFWKVTLNKNDENRETLDSAISDAQKALYEAFNLPSTIVNGMI